MYLNLKAPDVLDTFRIQNGQKGVYSLRNLDIVVLSEYIFTIEYINNKHYNDIVYYCNKKEDENGRKEIPHTKSIVRYCNM